MSELSKFFTPPLSKNDHARLLAVIGYDRWTWRFVERANNIVLQNWLWSEGAIHHSLSDELVEKDPTVILDHGPSLISYPDGVPSTLWEELLPFPMGHLSRFFLTPETSRIRCQPADYQADLRKLWDGFRQLEECVGRTEVCCVWFERGEESFALLTHSVRRKRVRIGTDLGLSVLRDQHREGSLTPQALREHFGTHASFLPVFLGESSLGDALRTALLHYIGPTALPPTYGELELDAEL